MALSWQSGDGSRCAFCARMPSVPFASKAQARKMFSLQSQGELKPGTAQEFAKATPSIKRLPEHAGDKPGRKRAIGALRR